MLSLGIEAVDSTLGGVQKGSYILLHEQDPRSMGRELAFMFLKKKLQEDNLIGMFNLSYPLPTLFHLFKKRGVDAESYLRSKNLVIIDTFGSLYGLRVDMEGVQYLKGSLSPEVLSKKYADVVGAHKEEWPRLGMFEGRELWGISMNINEYTKIFNESTVLSYFEVSAETRRRHRAYREYPTGTNIWVYVGGPDRVFASLYRRMDYVIRTRSERVGDTVKRYLCILKAPGMWQSITFEYSFTPDGVEFRRIY